MSYLFINFFWILGAYFILPTHDYHSSISEVRYRSNKQTIEVVLRVFTDDLELALKRAKGVKNIALDNTKKYHAEIGAYVLANFQIQNSKKEILKATYIGKEIDNDQLDLYIEFPAKGYSNKWKIRNMIMTEVFDDQNNIVNVFFGDKSISAKTMMFRKSSTWESLP